MGVRVKADLELESLGMGVPWEGAVLLPLQQGEHGGGESGTLGEWRGLGVSPVPLGRSGCRGGRELVLE